MPVEVEKYTIGEVLDKAVARYAEKEAIGYGIESTKERVTYKQLQERVNNLAKGLIALGIKKGDKIGMWMPDSLEWVYMYFAAAKVGAVSVPINARHRINDAEYIINHSDSVLVVISDKAPEKVDYVDMMYSISPGIRDAEDYNLSLSEFPSLRYLVTVGKARHQGMLQIGGVMKLGADKITDSELNEREHQVSRADLATFLYTSGTTAFPKGCVLTHEIIVRNGLACASCLELDEGQERYYDPTPPFHNLGICYGLITSLVYGCCRIGTEHFDPVEALKIMDTEKCTVTGGFDIIVMAWLEHSDFNKYDLSSLRTGYLAAPPAVQRLVRTRLPGYIPVNIYGLTEIGSNFTSTRRSDEFEVQVGCNGKPHEGLRLKIVAPKTNQEVPIGHRGEICCGGWTLMKGYYKDPATTAKTIDREGWLHTGDVGFIDDKTGYLVWEGRIKDTIKVGGENVAPAEVEGFLLQHPKVRMAQVVGIPDKRYGEVGAAFVELKEGDAASEQEIIDFCRGKIASFKIPRYVRFIEEWPRSATKVQKFKLRNQLQQELGL